MKHEHKKTIIKYSIATLIALIVSGIVMWWCGLDQAETLADKYKAIADGFTVPGIVMMCFGALLHISSDGFFDGISYAVGRAVRALTFRGASNTETYYDYKTRKGEKRISGYGFIFFVGLFITLLALIFTALYFTVA